MRKPREILMPFTDDMVLAIMAGRKTQTRRALRPQPQSFVTRMSVSGSGLISSHDDAQNMTWNTFRVGDRIGVRESAKIVDSNWKRTGSFVRIEYRADKARSELIEYPTRLQPLVIGNSIPNGVFREGVRTWLEVTGVRVERLNEISEADAIAEGIESRNTAIDTLYRDHMNPMHETKFANYSFGTLWQSIYGKGSFDGRWVIVTEFKVATQ